MSWVSRDGVFLLDSDRCLGCHRARCPHWVGSLGLLLRVTRCPPGVAQGIQRCVTATDSYHLGIVPPGMTINPRRSGWLCALARRECPMGVPLMVKPLTLFLGPDRGGSCMVRCGCSCIIRVWGVDNFLLSSKTLT